ncbi:hypothetical protein [Brevibacterium atlanticum]|uniref:hypothetical protein n=1 Tax=Brevibacterium atlanticum TaxID=2697563 RepID=UPI00141F9892|nr:hypothetical protein [Brevibacterium atlanticum]
MTQKQLHQPVRHPSQQTDLTVRVGLVATSAWSLFLLIMSVLWGTGAAPAAFAGDEEGAFTSVIASLPVPIVAGLVGFVALLSFVSAAVLLTVPRLRAQLRERAGVRVVGLLALFFTIITTVLFTNTLLLAYLGYVLSMQFPPISGPVIWQAVMLLGPLLWLIVWAAAEHAHRRSTSRVAGGLPAAGEGQGTVGYVRATASLDEDRGAVRGAGHDEDRSAAVSTSAKVAVTLAVIVPGFYALTRILWAIGIPVGLSDTLYEEGVRTGLWHSGLALALAAVAGILLTLGLVQKWGERLPAWLGPLSGRRVPITLATIPATIVTLALFTGGVGMMRTVVAGPSGIFADSWWATVGPTLLFPVWAVALGWATFAYRQRRLATESRS